MRSFPGAARPRLATLVTGVVALAALGVPLAQADDEDDLKGRQHDVQGRIDDASDDLDEASRTATRAAAAVARTVARLESARGRLDDVRGRLDDARGRAAELRSDLADARDQLMVAELRLAAGGVAVERQRGQVRATVLGNYTQGDPTLRAFDSFFEAESLADVQLGLTGESVVVNAQANAFDDLEDAEADLEVERTEVEQHTADVADRKQAAAEHVADVRVLVGQARTARARVRDAVAGAREARARAVAARRHDRAVLARLRERERAIAARLRRLAEQQASQRGYVGDSGGFLSMPVTGGYVTSPFGYRIHPIYGYYRLHDGTDIGKGCGVPLLAAAGGTVIETYYSSSYGNRLYLSIGNVNGKNLVLVYNHMSGYAAQEGERVERGEAVGYMGTTGWSTGCHLHFTVMADGTAVDPMTYL